MNYELAKQLKDAGFPQVKLDGYAYTSKSVVKRDGVTLKMSESDTYAPTLSELIEACGDTVFFDLVKCKDGWVATDHYLRGDGVTPTEAVARLWLALNTTL